MLKCMSFLPEAILTRQCITKRMEIQQGQIFIDEEPVPEGTPETSVETVDVGEETIPGDSSLPAAGGIPAEVFYAAGGLFIAVALVLTFTRKKAAS